jgi:Ser/Thr protein kinase RdoA (MazF antagonist)
VTDAAVIGRLLDEYHERSVPPADIEVISGSVHEARVTYRLTLADGSGQVIRAFRADAPVPVHGRGPVTETVLDWLLGRAATLAVLKASGYRASRPVLTRTGELIGVAGPWLAWATSYVPGTVLEPTLSQLRALGESLGRLHSVGARAGAGAGAGAGAVTGGSADAGAPGAASALAPGLSSRHPAVAAPATLARLDALADTIPPDWAPMAATFRRTVLAVAEATGSVPDTIVHGDVWARNAVQAGHDGPVTLIDWETGGLGLAVLDLGNCLMECHVDAAVPDSDPEAWLISPDEDRIAAVARAYTAVRSLVPAERDLLPHALRFSAAVVGAIHFELALTDGVGGPTMDARLARLENRLDVAPDVAALAAPYLG